MNDKFVEKFWKCYFKFLSWCIIMITLIILLILFGIDEKSSIFFNDNMSQSTHLFKGFVISSKSVIMSLVRQIVCEELRLELLHYKRKIDKWWNNFLNKRYEWSPPTEGLLEVLLFWKISGGHGKTFIVVQWERESIDKLFERLFDSHKFECFGISVNTLWEIVTLIVKFVKKKNNDI